MNANDDRITQLEARLQRLEDEREITQLVASYGPLVDSGAAEDVASLWVATGVYDIDEAYLEGHEQLVAMVRSKAHQGWISGGCAHFLGPAHVTVTGETAVAVCHSLMVIREDDRFIVRRATANHWELARTAGGWRVNKRTSRVLDGRAESPALLSSGVRGIPADDRPRRSRMNDEVQARLHRALGAPVPYAEHSQVQVQSMSAHAGSVATLPEDVRLTNHVGSQHAGALFTAGETAASAAVAGALGEGMASLRPLVTAADISYHALARGPITATAELDDSLPDVLAALDADGRARFTTTVGMTNTDQSVVATMTVHWYVSRKRSAS